MSSVSRRTLCLQYGALTLWRRVSSSSVRFRCRVCGDNINFHTLRQRFKQGKYVFLYCYNNINGKCINSRGYELCSEVNCIHLSQKPAEWCPLVATESIYTSFHLYSLFAVFIVIGSFGDRGSEIGKYTCFLVKENSGDF